MTRAKMSSCLEYAEAGLETGTEGEVLRMKGAVLRRIKEINEESGLITTKALTEADIELVTDKADYSCQTFGEILTKQTAKALNCYATGEGTKRAVVGQMSSIEVHPFTVNNTKCTQLDIDLCAQIHDKYGPRLSCKGTQENGQYKITYKPVVTGEHSLHIKINGKHIKGSPYPVFVAPSPKSLQKPLRVVHLGGKPLGITINSKDEIIVVVEQADTGILCNTVLTLEGEHISTFGEYGKRKPNDFRKKRGIPYASLNTPCGVTVDQDDNIYVVDNANNCILKFIPDGNQVEVVGAKGSDRLQFNTPVGICFNKIDKLLYVCEPNNHRIQVLTTDLTFVRSIQTRDEQYRFMAFDRTNNLYVTDYKNGVRVFTPEGQFLRAFSDKANGEKRHSPHSLAIDSSDIVYVTENGRSYVNLFTAEGEFITAFGTKGREEGQFHGACDICTYSDELVIVCDHHNQRLQIFKLY